jgi:hypothetical protein
MTVASDTAEIICFVFIFMLLLGRRTSATFTESYERDDLFLPRP